MILLVARAVQQPMRSPNQQRETHPKSTQKTRTNKQERRPNTILNEVRQFAYVLGARERDLIDSIVNYKLQFMGAIPFNL